MKQKDLVRHLKKHGCVFFNEGANHTHYINLKNPSIKVPVPRHKEISDFLAIKICKELDIPLPD